jgi:2-oxoglutarate dehydrogenase E2 component (dihydrolipoamide succinyltransferase)
MSLFDLTVPALGESISEGTITVWRVAAGQAVAVDQPLLELETDKVTAEIPSPVAGVVRELLFAQGADVQVGAVVARIEVGARAGAAEPAAPAPVGAAPPAPAPAASAPRNEVLPPAARRAASELGVDPAAVLGSGRRGQVLKEDVIAHANRPVVERIDPASTMAAIAPILDVEAPLFRASRRVPMTRMRRRIAERLKEVQNTAAILTTFNEVDMSGVMALRARYGESFQKAHGVKLGFMSFFVKASVEALKSFPALNGGIDGGDVLYNDFFDIGVAVSTDKGLVVPVLRDADRLSFAEVEKLIGEMGKAARDGSLTLDQLSGGTFSITNGGIFGSMLSTPILNPPQSGILGMHAIQNRPVAVGDKVEIRPIMYVALSYDHRLVDGSQAVSFLVKVKQIVEDPARLLLEV